MTLILVGNFTRQCSRLLNFASLRYCCLGAGLKASHVQELGKYSSSEFDDPQPTFFLFTICVCIWCAHVYTQVEA